ncbi:sulfatase-like hydrolase/transferase [Catenuloplanes atrovinosus]|uniref:sulfatase-like hydrolase/transferase n=1 Tax=Catenuloplanes atrovinosus TaxID=137266 RepID=UPI00286BB2E1|nr:sulfatase-like hydrolase/transferase [Catenuloplanes atrovinosus]
MRRAPDLDALAPDTRAPDTPAAETPAVADDQVVRRRLRTVGGWALTLAAAALVLGALLSPNQVSSLGPAAFLRLPLEALIAVAVLRLLPRRPRTVLAAVLGVLLGVLLIVKLVDMGFYQTLSRSFDLVLDWPFFGDAYNFVKGNAGTAAAWGAIAGVLLLAVAVLAAMAASMIRLTGFVVRHDRASVRTVAVLTVIWVLIAGTGLRADPGGPVAAWSTARMAADKVRQVNEGLADSREFAELAANDAFRDVPPEQLLTGLRGKDVFVTFIESYGRTAVEGYDYTAAVTAALDAGQERLSAQGFDARSGWLTSPTAGGGSWLAHSTFQSGLWIENQERYRNLVSTEHTTLTGAFQRADWRTVGVMPALTYAWPEQHFYGFDQVYDSETIGYEGEHFTWVVVPDQFSYSVLQRRELGDARRGGPVMAEIDTLSSHTPWTKLPTMVDWDAVGDGTIFTPQARAGVPTRELWSNSDRVRAAYRQSIEYSIEALTSWISTYGDENTVLVFLGDHQPAPIITGENATRDVPITVVAKDPAVLDRISSWGWTPGLTPAPDAPVWRMDAFRDRFLTAFSDLQ